MTIQDRQEIMEALFSRSKRKLKPYSFDKICNNTGIFKQCNVVDGLNMSIMMPFNR